MSNIKQFIANNLNHGNDDPFMVFNVEDVIQRHKNWLKLLPRVVPYYAVKANPFPLLLNIMVAIGLKFDCSSQFEVEELLRSGAKPEDIISSNPTKSDTFLEYSKKNQVDLIVIDNVNELVKVKSVFPLARIVIRIQVEERYSAVNLGLKYGADRETVGKILKTAKLMKLNVIGISFHVGTGCQSSRAYIEGIRNSKIAFDMAKEMGFNMSLLDIGGGYPGSTVLYYRKIVDHRSDFKEMARDINKCLDQYFPDPHLRIIGEPGRYYSETAFTLVTKVISKNVIDSNGGQTFMYFLNDGIFHTFFNITLDKRMPHPIPFVKDLEARNLHFTTLWGPTCTSVDAIKTDFLMYELNIGEWVIFKDMGTYSVTYAKNGFNGFPFPSFKIFLTEWAKSILIKTEFWPKINSYLSGIKTD